MTERVDRIGPLVIVLALLAVAATAIPLFLPAPVGAGLPAPNPAPGLGAAPTGSAQQSGRWPTTPHLPYWRRNHSAIHDVANGRLVIFGGWNGQRFFNDVWALDLTPGAEQWIQIQPQGVRPPPRAWHTAVYDAANGRMVLFGGRGYGGDLADLWVLDLAPGAERWDPLAPSAPTPPALSAHSAAYDAGGPRMLVFAGRHSGALQGDLWQLDLTTPGSEAWSLLKLSGDAPSPRAFHTAIVDGAQDRLILFGGLAATGNLSDTWALDLTPGSEDWQELATGGDAPPARRFHSAVYDANGSRMIVFGGAGSAGFLDDLWALDLAPGSEAWEPLASAPPISYASTGDGPGHEMPLAPADWPPGRAWHSASLAASRMWVLGGFGPLQTLLDQQWSLNVEVIGWERVTPVEPVLASYVSASLQVEDAPDGVLVNKLVGSWVDVAVNLASTSLEASQNIEVTLTAHGNPLGMPTACFQQTSAGPCLPLLVDAEGEGRYTSGVTGLPWHFGSWAGQIRFRFYVFQLPAEPVVDFTAQARFPGVGERDATASVRVCEHVEALIVTNRTRLYEAFDDGEVRLLLGRLYELAEAEGTGGEPLGVVAYVDGDSPAVAGWDNWEVDYASESTANTVARIVDDRIESWASHAGSPTYLLIVGDDDIVPFYRQPSYGDEAEYPEVGNYYKPLNDLVSNDYFFTDNPYADLDGDWEQGDLEMAAGRIVGESPADMLAFVDNSRLGPLAGSGQAVVMSVRDLEPQWPTGEAVRDAILAGPGNDLVDALYDDWGLNVLVDGDKDPPEWPVTIETRDWDRDDLETIMASGFLVFQSMGHAENKYLLLPDDRIFDASSWAAFAEDTGCLAANHPFFYIHGCRAGLSLARHKDDGLVWAWAHHGASGVIASAGLAYSDWDAEETGGGETLANQFWLRAIEGGRPVDTVGVVLRDAKRDFDARYDWSDSEKKTVQAYTLFGLPWMSLPEVGGARGTQPAAGPGWLVTDWEARPGQSLAENTYVVTATVDASFWAIDSLHGFDVVQVEGMRLSHLDDAPVVPVKTFRLALPRQAAVTGVTAVLSDEVDLGTLNIPTLIHRADYPGGLPSVYTETLAEVGVYPPQAYQLDVTPFDSWQVARLSLTPLVYDAAGDQATLFQQMLVSVTYTATTPVAGLGLQTSQATYLPGQAIAASAWLRNVSGADLPLTPTLSIANPAGQVLTLTVGAPVTLTAGSLSSVPVGMNPVLDEGAYRLRFRAWSQGQVVADLARDLSVLAGQIVSLTAPETLSPGESGQFQVTFANARPDPAIALVHLAVLDPAGQMVSDLQPRVMVVPGAATAGVAFDWQPEGDLPGIYVGLARVLSGGYVYGPTSRPIRVLSGVYLPLVMRDAGE